MNRLLPIRVTRRAAGEISQAVAWWTRNRPAVPEALAEELERAFEAHTRAGQVICAAGEYLPFGGDFFDLVLSHEVLEHVANDHQAAVEIDRDNPEYWGVLAKFSIGHNFQVQEAGLGAARQALLLSPRNPVYLDLLGTAYMILGDLDNAERFFQQALERDPEQAKRERQGLEEEERAVDHQGEIQIVFYRLPQHEPDQERHADGNGYGGEDEAPLGHYLEVLALGDEPKITHRPLPRQARRPALR